MKQKIDRYQREHHDLQRQIYVSTFTQYAVPIVISIVTTLITLAIVTH